MANNKNLLEDHDFPSHANSTDENGKGGEEGTAMNSNSDLYVQDPLDEQASKGLSMMQKDLGFSNEQFRDYLSDLQREVWKNLVGRRIRQASNNQIADPWEAPYGWRWQGVILRCGQRFYFLSVPEPAIKTIYRPVLQSV